MLKPSCRPIICLRYLTLVALLTSSRLTSKAGEQLDAKSSSPVEAKKETTSTNLLSFWDGRIVFDIEERMRGEIRNNTRDFDSAINDDNDDSWLLNRFRLGLAIQPVPWLKLYGQTQDIREGFSDRANIPGIRGAEGDDEFDLRQAYVAIGDLKKGSLQLTLGRQAVTYGDGRLVADSKWNNLGRTFDAVRLRYENRYNFWVEAFFMRPVQVERHEFNTSDSADNFGGVYFSTDYGLKRTVDFYVYYRDKEDNQPDLDPTNKIDPQGSSNGPAARFAVLGLRTKNSSDALKGWDYSGEFVYEIGEVFQTDTSSKRFDLNAFALAVSGGYTWKDTPWKPRVGLEYDFATGDRDPNDGDSESFQNLYPSNHDKYGLMDEFGWRNMHDFRVQLNVKPIQKLDLEFHYHALWLADTHDFWYRSNGLSTLRTKTPDGRDVRTIGASNFAGHELDLIATYELNRFVKLQTGYAHFFAGSYLSDTGPSSDADFGFVMTTFNF